MLFPKKIPLGRGSSVSLMMFFRAKKATAKMKEAAH
jgi:hypothetical protein